MCIQTKKERSHTSRWVSKRLIAYVDISIATSFSLCVCTELTSSDVQTAR